MKYAILNADFRDTLAAARGAGGAHLVATSPPYPDARTCYEGLKWEDYQALGDAVLDALVPGGHCLLNLGSPVRQLRDGHGTERNPLPYRVMLDWIDRVGLTCPDVLVFGRDGLPGEYLGRFRSDHEPLFWFRRPGETWQLDKPNDRTAPYRMSASARERNGSLKGPTNGNAILSGRTRGTVWGYGSVGHGQTGDGDIGAQGHPARWPYRLAADIVKCFTAPGDLVVDPFLGGGTTLCAACDTRRRFIGGDLDGQWAARSQELADNRYSQLTIQGRLAVSCSAADV